MDGWISDRDLARSAMAISAAAALRDTVVGILRAPNHRVRAARWLTAVQRVPAVPPACSHRLGQKWQTVQRAAAARAERPNPSSRR